MDILRSSNLGAPQPSSGGVVREIGYFDALVAETVIMLFFRSAPPFPGSSSKWVVLLKMLRSWVYLNIFWLHTDHKCEEDVVIDHLAQPHEYLFDCYDLQVLPFVLLVQLHFLFFIVCGSQYGDRRWLLIRSLLRLLLHTEYALIWLHDGRLARGKVIFNKLKWSSFVAGAQKIIICGLIGTNNLFFYLILFNLPIRESVQHESF